MAAPVEKISMSLGALLVVLGSVWILQGTGLLKGSFMTGEPAWGWIGAICLVAGLAVLVIAQRRSSR